MASSIDELTAMIAELETRLEAEIMRQRDALETGIKHGRVVLSDEMRRGQRALRMPLGAFLRRTRPLIVLTAPVIYSVIIPFVLLDIFVSFYQAVCFPIYGIKKVPRGDFIVFDRHHLGYLNGLQKVNCLYCAYGNGLVAWVQEVSGRTEQYWCPIKHARRLAAAHAHYREFPAYGDGAEFQARLDALRAELAEK